ncbi:MAG: MgtC/SapB family protein [Chloroflexi bacterium]|nr:MgtC/SapB family protein [Chloroflexota bacterium]MBP8058510.1 MgtC/SapB family protein [Chloroflexota bacterium]
MEWETELWFSLRVLVAAILGALIGLEREIRGHDAGIRTYAAVTLGSCAFAIVSQASGASGDANRIAAQVVSGIGFLGAGVIIRGTRHVNGLTTSAMLWAAASVGLAIGYGYYILGTLTAVICVAILLLRRAPVVAKVRQERKSKQNGTGVKAPTESEPEEEAEDKEG